MLPAALYNWFGRAPTVAPVATQAVSDRTAAARQPISNVALPTPARATWTAARLLLTDQLWGKGFTIPGGEMETLRLVRPLGLSSASSLLLVGAGGGGVAGTIVRNTGAWVSGLEADITLLKKAQALMKVGQLGKKASIEAWDPEQPNFVPRRHHHCLALEPLWSGNPPEPIFDALAQTLKPGGQLVITELVADTLLPAYDPTVSRWGKLESRKLASLPTSNGISRMLTRVGFDVRIVEDISDRHRNNAMLGWRKLVRDLEEQRPGPLLAAQLVAEAELWLLRMRLLREKRVKMVRWHAIDRAGSRAPVS